MQTRWGYVGLAGRDGRLARSTLPEATRAEAIETVQAGVNVSYVEDEAAFGDLPDRLMRYFAGERVDFSDVAIDVSAYPPFHRRAILAAQQIGYGELATYAELARVAGSPNAARAVGNAMASNRTPIVVPCHRVVAANGKLGAFSGGLDWKRELLELEGVGF